MILSYRTHVTNRHFLGIAARMWNGRGPPSILASHPMSMWVADSKTGAYQRRENLDRDSGALVPYLALPIDCVTSLLFLTHGKGSYDKSPWKGSQVTPMNDREADPQICVWKGVCT